MTSQWETRMERRKPAGLHWQRRVPEPLQTIIKIAAMVAIAAAPLMVLTSLFPRPLVLPVLCLVAIAGAGTAALFAWTRGKVHDRQRIIAWDVAGALAFIACAAAIMSNPEQVAVLTSTVTIVSDLS
jgi:hypothetical protein